MILVEVRGGARAHVLDDLIDLSSPVWSPCSRQLAFSGVTASGDRRYHLYVVDARSGRRQLTREVTASPPAWLPRRHADRLVVAPDGRDERTIVKLPGGEISGPILVPLRSPAPLYAQKRPPED